MHVRLALILVPVLLTLTPSLRPAEITQEINVTMEPVANAYADSGVAGVHPQGPQYLFVANNKDPSVDARYWHVGDSWIYLRFDLTRLPRGASATSAKLQSYAVFATSMHKVGAHYSRVNDWTEIGLNFRTAPRWDPEPEDTQEVAKESSWYAWTVTETVNKGLRSNDRKITMVLVSENEHLANNWVGFYSTRQGDVTKGLSPRLVVSYVASSGGPDYLGDLIAVLGSISLPAPPSQGVVVALAMAGAILLLAVRRRRRGRKQG